MRVVFFILTEKLNYYDNTKRSLKTSIILSTTVLELKYNTKKNYFGLGGKGLSNFGECKLIHAEYLQNNKCKNSYYCILKDGKAMRKGGWIYIFLYD